MWLTQIDVSEPKCEKKMELLKGMDNHIEEQRTVEPAVGISGFLPWLTSNELWSPIRDPVERLH